MNKESSSVARLWVQKNKIRPIFNGKDYSLPMRNSFENRSKQGEVIKETIREESNVIKVDFSGKPKDIYASKPATTGGD